MSDSIIIKKWWIPKWPLTVSIRFENRVCKNLDYFSVIVKLFGWIWVDKEIYLEHDNQSDKE